MRVVIVDDEPLARSGVAARLAACIDIDVVAEFGDGPAALDGIAALDPDLVFIDIEMPGMNGLEVLAALAPRVQPMAILLTAYDNFAMQAFALNVVDYLLKPIDDDRFAEATERARQALPYRRAHAHAQAGADMPTSAQTGETSYIESFTVRRGSRILFIHVGEVEWIAADGDYATLHVGARQYMVRESLQRMAQRLDPKHFVRVHRSAIVRIEQVVELRSLTNRDAMLRLRDGTPLRASRSYIAPLIAALQNARSCVIS